MLALGKVLLFPPLKRHWKKRNICQHVAFQKATLMGFLPIFLWKTGASKDKRNRTTLWLGTSAIRRAEQRSLEVKISWQVFHILNCMGCLRLLSYADSHIYIHIWVCCNLYLVLANACLAFHFNDHAPLTQSWLNLFFLDCPSKYVCLQSFGNFRTITPWDSTNIY